MFERVLTLVGRLFLWYIIGLVLFVCGGFCIAVLGGFVKMAEMVGSWAYESRSTLSILGVLFVVFAAMVLVSTPFCLARDKKRRKEFEEYQRKYSLYVNYYPRHNPPADHRDLGKR